jgi:o-succinylbenzoate synthase
VRACEQALSALDTDGIPDRIAANQDLIGELGRASVRIPPNLPAARAALEAALLDLWSRGAGLPAWQMLASGLPDATKPGSRALSALLSGEPEQALTQAIAAQSRGVTTYKFKIGRLGALQRELAAVRALRTELGPLARLRLDANQALSVADAREFLPLFAACDLEFIEEPCAPAELAQLADLALPLALDESLALGARPRVGDRAVIAKPTLQGGVIGSLALAQAASAIGAELIFSHAFEGPLGLGLSAALALSIGSDTLAHGLDAAGAGHEAPTLPWYSGARLCAWHEPGFGILEQP